MPIVTLFALLLGVSDPCLPPPPLTNLVSEINVVRQALGLVVLKDSPGLACAAQTHAKDVGYRRICSHTGFNGSSPWDRAKACKTTADAEIVACGHLNASEAVKGWLASPAHAAVIRDPLLRSAGGGWSQNYWVVVFAK